MRQKGALKAGLIQRVTVAPDQETITWFKTQTGGPAGRGGWNWSHSPFGTMPGTTLAGSYLRYLPGIDSSGNNLSEMPAASPSCRKCEGPADAGAGIVLTRRWCFRSGPLPWIAARKGIYSRDDAQV